MSELASPDEPFIAASGGNRGRRKAAAQTHGVNTIAETSARAAAPILVGACESQLLRVCRPRPSEPFIENLKLRTA
jgi:hypothetical protein